MTARPSPDAVAVSGVVEHIIEQQPSLVLLDLTALQRSTRPASPHSSVSVVISRTPTFQVRVIAAEPTIQHRLPYTLGLRKVFPTVEEAMRYQP